LYFLAAWGDGQYLPSNTVDIEGTTCAVALRQGAYHCRRDVIACFPQNPRLAPMGVESYMGVALQNRQGQSLGTLCIFARQPIADPEHAEQILRVFAARAAAELERQRAERAMEQLNRELEIRVRDRTAQLAASEDRLKTLFNQAADAVFLLGEQGFIDCNEAAVALLRYSSKTELLTLRFHQISPERQPDGQLSNAKAQVMIQAALQRCGFQFEWVHQRSDGELFWAEITLTPIKYQEEMIFHCITRDVSARKQLEREQARLTAVLEATPDFIGIADAHGEILWHNKPLRELRKDLGNPEDHRSIANCHPDWVNKIIRDEALPTAIQQGSWSGELALLDGEGNEIPVSQVIIAHKAASGEVETFSTVMRDIRDRKQTEAALKLSEARARANFTQAAVGFVELDIRTKKFVRVNNCFCEMLGYTSAELAEMTVREITYPDDIPASIEATQQLHKGEIDNFNLEKRYVRKDGTTFWANTTCYMIKPHGDEAIYSVALVQDISEEKRLDAERQRATIALQLSEARANAAFEQAAVGIAESNLTDGKITRTNNRFCQMTGYTPQELKSLTAADLTHPEDISDSRNKVKQLYTGKIKSFTVEKRYLRKDRSYFWATTAVALIQNPEEDSPRCLAVVQDISDRKQAENALYEEQLRLKLALGAAQMGTWSCSLQTGKLIWSDRTQKIFGFEPGTFPGNRDTFAAMIHPDDHDRVMAAIATTFETGTPYHLEYRIRRLGGEIRWISAWGRLFSSLSSNGPQLVGVVTDISDRKQAEEQLRQSMAQLEASNNELEAFAYSISHDLRAPLRAINGFSQALLEDYGELFDEEGQYFFERIRANTNRMGDLIDDLLRLSRVSRSELSHNTVDLSALAQEVLHDLQKAEPERKVEVIVTPGLTVFADTALMQVVLMNLLQNAWKFTSHHPTARIEFGVLPAELHETPASVYFIKDDGAGFDMAYSHKLFGVFQRLHSIEEFSGTGIGLATVQRAIHRHGGQVWANASVEQGATFFFTVPIPSEETLWVVDKMH
ncbi:MAG: PAS domain S-box protein, partial [Leptolyngbya sp. SIO3F4]|nr:PAS domain S-box protein [Leptolyngbya sp. SIO3F4]